MRSYNIGSSTRADSLFLTVVLLARELPLFPNDSPSPDQRFPPANKKGREPGLPYGIPASRASEESGYSAYCRVSAERNELLVVFD